MRYLTLYISLFFISSLFAQEVASIKGVIFNNSNLKPISGANVYIVDSDLGTVSNESGLFLLSLDNLKNNEIKISMIGFKDTTLFVNYKNIKNKYKIFLIPKTIQMSGVTVHSHEKSKDNVAPSSISLEEVRTYVGKYVRQAF